MTMVGSRKIIAFLSLLLLIGGAITFSAYARRNFYYYNMSGTQEERKNRCIADASPYSGAMFPSVNNYACDKATRTPQEGCAAWLSAPGKPGSTTINVTSVSGAAPLSVYGMCTDNTYNVTAALQVCQSERHSDSGCDTLEPSITLSSGNLMRGEWGYPESGGVVNGTLDIGKFIEGVAPVREGGYYVYTKPVWLWRLRVNPDGSSSNDVNPTIIKVKIGGAAPPPTDDLCGAWTPESYLSSNAYSGTTSVQMKIKNKESRFGAGGTEWSDGPVYAMPTDTIEWFTCYYPGVQATADTKVSSVDGIKVEEFDDLSETECMRPAPEAKFKLLHEASLPWENRFEITGVTTSASFNSVPFPISGGTNTPGDIMTQQNDNEEKVERHEAGGTFKEEVDTGVPLKADIEVVDEFEEVATATGICKNKYKNGPTAEATVVREDSGLSHDEATAIVPYNFVNSTSITLSSDPVFSGEKVKIGSVQYRVGMKYNGKTQATYATQVPGAKFKLVAYVSSTPGGTPSNDSNGCTAVAGLGSKQCLELVEKEDAGELHSIESDGDLYTDAIGSVSDWSGREYNAFDAAAGDYMCIVSAISPADSGSDENITIDYNKWQYSTPACAVIAKKPTFQVWGGSLYSADSIKANKSTKWNIYNEYCNYSASGCVFRMDGTDTVFKKTGGDNSKITFMPWTEESLVLKDGVTSTVASGAATGLNSNEAGAGNKASFSKMSALSFANFGSGSIGTDEVGNSGIDSGIKDREALIDYWADGIESETFRPGKDEIKFTSDTNNDTILIPSTTIRFAYKKGNITVGGTVPKGVTYLIKSDGTVTINGDIVYDDSGYTQISEIPKVIIYAKNIKINCTVNRIDAILITSIAGDINTCPSTGDYNAEERSHQLKIFGVAITDTIDLARTYGNAANKDGAQIDSYGMPSDGAAAEIFDYDTSIFMWAQSVSGSANTDVLQTAYQHEVAPRY